MSRCCWTREDDSIQIQEDPETFSLKVDNVYHHHQIKHGNKRNGNQGQLR